jgi:hypothetical protein
VGVTRVTWAPLEPEPGNIVSFTVTITNKHTSTIRVRYIGLHIDWQPQGIYSYEDYGSSPIVIPPNQNYQVNLVLTIPTNTSYAVHPYIIRVDYDTDTSSHSEKSDEFQNFLLQENKTPPQDDDNLLTDSAVLGGLALIVVVALIVIILYLRNRSIRRAKMEKRRQYRSALEGQQQEEEVELAQTVTRVRRKGPMTAMAKHERKEAEGQKLKPWDPAKGEDIEAEAHKEETVQMPQKPPQAPPRSMGGGHQPQPMPQQPPPSVQPMPQQPPAQGPRPMPVQPPPTTQPQAPPQAVQQPAAPPQYQQAPPAYQKPMPPTVPPPTPTQPQMKTCPTCRTLLEPGVSRCQKCGRYL